MKWVDESKMNYFSPQSIPFPFNPQAPNKAWCWWFTVVLGVIVFRSSQLRVWDGCRFCNRLLFQLRKDCWRKCFPSFLKLISLVSNIQQGEWCWFAVILGVGLGLEWWCRDLGRVWMASTSLACRSCSCSCLFDDRTSGVLHSFSVHILTGCSPKVWHSGACSDRHTCASPESQAWQSLETIQTRP